MSTFILLVIAVCIAVVVVKKLSGSSPSAASKMRTSRDSNQSPPMVEQSAADLAQKAIDKLAAVNEQPERIRELWRAGKFEPLNLAKQALAKDAEHSFCHQVVMKVSTYLVQAMHKLKDYDSADEVCTEAQCSATVAEDFAKALVLTWARFDQQVVEPMCGTIQALKPLSGQPTDNDRIALSKRVYERAERTLLHSAECSLLKKARLSWMEIGTRYEWAARLDPTLGDAWYWAGTCLLNNTEESLDEGNRNLEWAKTALTSAKVNMERASRLIPQDKNVWEKMEKIDVLIAQCS